MKRLLGILLIAGASVSPAYAGAIAFTPGSGGNVGAGTDGTYQIPAVILCGGAAGTLYTTCADQLYIDSSGYAHVSITNSSLAVTGTFWQTTQPISAASLPLPTGAATATNQTNITGSASGGTAAVDSQLDGGIYNSTPPTLTNGQQASLQFTSAGSLHATIDNTNANGQTTMSASSPVTIASDQSAVATKAASGAFVAGSIADLAHGQGTMAASVPVAIASNQSGVPVTGTFWQTTQPVSGTFWQTTQPVSLNATPSLANGNGTVPTQGGAVLSATNGGYQNLLQGNAALSATNGLPVAPSPYPAGSTPITASATGTTAATTATLTNVTGHTTYICGFSIRANATAAATGNATVTGTISGTLNFTQWTAPNASGVGVTEIPFAPCVPASAVSTSIAVVSAAPGTGGVVSVTAWGYSI